MNNIDYTFYRLSLSKFRSGFKLKEKEINYIDNLGMDKIKEHAYKIINDRLAPEIIENDGHQTPMKNHPVFIAQHATATCCRGCLYKWHHIEMNKKLNDKEIDYIVNIIMKWINNQYKGEKNEKH